MEKQAEATAVPNADSAVTQASMAPIPTAAVGNKPAPGQTGPKGMAPRTNYSRVNSGSSPSADLGATAQKSLAPDSQSFLPHKVAHTEVQMSAVTHTMTIHELVKAAAASVTDRVAMSKEAERQTASSTPAVKVASVTDESIPTAYIDKLAEAMEFVVKEAAPGEGPNSLTVTDSHVGGKNPFTPGSQGQATPAHVISKTPGLHAPSEVSKGPANALDDNSSMKHPAQPTKLSSVSADELRKAVLAKVASKAEETKEMCKGCGKEKSACSCAKTAAAGADPRLVDYFMKTVKLAEDAINPAKISAGAAVAPETSASGQAGGAPAGGMPKGNTSLIASNDSAINYTKRDAKAGTSSAMGKLLTEPALSAAHDKTLNMAFANTPKAGVKLASADPVRTAAARVILEKMAAEAKDEDDKKKKKESGGGSFTAPPVGGVAGSAGGM
jgi:hypothetical protein